jgi:hypothetical protein
LLREQPGHHLSPPRVRSKVNGPTHLAQESFLSDSPPHLFRTVPDDLQQHLLIDSSLLLPTKTPATTVVKLATRPASVLKYLDTKSIRLTNYTHVLWKLTLIIRKLVKLYSRKIATPKRRLLLRQDG